MFWETNGDNGRVLREPTSSFPSFRHLVHIWKGPKKNVLSNLQFVGIFKEKNAKEPI
jgi:hypothetical protein